MTDRFENSHAGLNSPALIGFDIVPEDDFDLTIATRAIYVGLGGDLAITMLGGGSVTLKNVPAGAILPVRVRRVLETTTAGQIVGFA